MSCEDAGCCGCCIPFTEQDQREAAESYRERQEAEGCDEDFENEGDGLSDVEADAMTLASVGHGTDEDYGYCEGYDEGEW